MRSVALGNQGTGGRRHFVGRPAALLRDVGADDLQHLRQHIGRVGRYAILARDAMEHVQQRLGLVEAGHQDIAGHARIAEFLDHRGGGRVEGQLRR